MKPHLPAALRSSLLTCSAMANAFNVSAAVTGTLATAALFSSHASAEGETAWAGPTDADGNLIAYPNTVNVANNTAQTVTENTLFNITAGSIGAITATGQDIKLAGQNNGSQMSLGSNAIAADTVWFSQGRFQLNGAALNNAQTIYAQGGQIYSTGGTITHNVFIGKSNFSEGNATDGCALRLEGGATGTDSNPSTTISGNVTLLEDAAVCVWNNYHGAITGTLDTGAYTFTKTGTGRLRFYVNAGTTLQNFERLVLSGGTLQSYNNRGANNSAIHVGTLDVAANSTLSHTFRNSIWTIDNLTSSAVNSSGLTLTLALTRTTGSRQKYMFTGTGTVADGDMFAGAINVTGFSDNANGNWQVEMHLGSAQLAKTTVNLANYTILAVNNDTATVAGLTSANANALVSSTAEGANVNTGGASDGTRRTLTLAGSGAYDYKGKIGNDLTLTKTGAGTQSLATIGNNVTVNHNAGTLKLNGAVGSGFTLNHADGVTIVFGANANLGAYSLSLSNLAVGGTVKAGTTLTAGEGGTLGTAAEGFTLNGGTIDFGNVTAPGYAAMSATGTLTFTSGNLVIDGMTSMTAGETIALLTGTNATTLSGTFAGITVNGNEINPSGYFMQNVDGSDYKFLLSFDGGDSSALNLSRIANATLTWNGGDGTWQTGATGWNADGATGGASTFSDNDEIIFAGNTSAETITLIGEVKPISITVQQGDYIFVAGDGGMLGGTTALSIGGGGTPATLTVNTANASWKGAADLKENGTLILGNADALGQLTLAFNGGALQYGSGVTTDISGQIIDGTGAVRVDTGGNNITWATNVLASHAIEKSGAGSLTLTLAAGAYSSALTVSAGDVILNVASGNTATYTGAMTGNGSVVKSGAGTLLINPTATLTGISLSVDAGTLQLGNNSETALAATVAPKSIVLGNNTTLQFLGSPSTLSSELTMKDGSMLTINDSRPTNPSYEAPSLWLTKDGTLSLSGGTAKIDCQYGRALRIDGQITGDGKLQMTNNRNGTLDWGGNFYIYLTNENNDFSGGIELLRQDGHLQVTNAGALGTGILNLSHAQSTLHYAGTANADGSYDSMKGGADQIITGAGGVEVLSGNLELKNANAYTGATTVTAGSLKVSGSVGTGVSANAYVVKNGASLVVSGTGSIANSSVAISAQQPAVAPLSGDTPAAEGTLRNVTVNTTKISRTDAAAQASIDNGKIDIAAATYTIENVALTNSLITLQNAGTLTLSNVTIGAGTVIDRGTSGIALQGNNTLVMTTANTTVGSLTTDATSGLNTLQVTSSALQGLTSFTGTLTLDLTEQWVYALVDAVKEQGNFSAIELTFTGIQVDAEAWNGVNLAATGALDTFSNLSITHGSAAGQVIISTAPQNIPEPATATLSLAGLAALLLRRRRRA